MALNCGNCGFKNEDSAKFCLNCGNSLQNQELSSVNEVQCPYCQSIIQANVSKCKYCGEWVKNPPQNYSYDIYKSYDYTILFGYIFSFLGGLIGFIIAIYLLTRDNKEAKQHGKYQIIISAVIILLFIINGIISAMYGSYYDYY